MTTNMKIRRVYIQDGRHYYVQDLEQRNPKTGRPKQKWHPLTRVDEGEPALHKALAELLGEPQRRRGNMPALLLEFRSQHLPGLKNSIVRKEYERMYDVVAKAFVEFDAAAVQPGDVLAFLKDFADHPNSRAKYKARLSTFFSWCVLNSHTGVEVNPCREIRMKEPPKRKGKMTAERFWRIWDHLSPMGRCFLELMFYTRQRPTEIRLLRDSHIGPNEFPDYIHFTPTKTEDETALDVHILITPKIRAVIKRARALRPAGKVIDLRRRADPFIIQTRTGDGYSKNGFYEVWRSAIDAAGYTGMNITTKDVRPYALKKMEDAGADLREIQKSAVHASVTTTEVYLEQHRDRLSDARLSLPERPGKPG